MCQSSQVTMVQSQFIQKYMRQVFFELVKVFVKPMLSVDDYADLVLKDTFMIGVVIDCLHPTLRECTEQV